MNRKKLLLIVAHMPSKNTRRMAEQVLAGASHVDIESVAAVLKSPFDTTPEDVIQCQGIILGTTENLGYMSGALKDFFDRIYYPCLEVKQGLPFGVYIRAGHDGTGSSRAINTIITGLKWRQAHELVLCRGDYQESFLDECHDLGMTMAASMDAGII